MAKSKDDQAHEQINADVPTFYSNSVALGISPFDLTLAFGLRTGGETIEPQTKVIMSLEHAIVTLLVTRRALREHAKNTGITIEIPAAILRDLQLDEESPLW